MGRRPLAPDRTALRNQTRRTTHTLLIPKFTSNRPQSDHPAHHLANEMAFAHNAMLRGLNAIYLQAPHVTQCDAPDFLFFVTVWAGWIMHHHDLEEEMLFPMLERIEGVEKGALMPNRDQHATFHGQLDSVKEYARAAAGEQFDGRVLCGMIEGFGDVLRAHLEDEIATLWALDCLPEEHAKGITEVLEVAEREAMKQNLWEVHPMVLGLRDVTYPGSAGWPAMPAVAGYVVNYVLAWRHSGAWRFLPCNHFGTPRELRFLGNGD